MLHQYSLLPVLLSSLLSWSPVRAFVVGTTALARQNVPAQASSTVLYPIRCYDKYYQLEEMEDKDTCTTELYLCADGEIEFGDTDGPRYIKAEGRWHVEEGTNDYEMMLVRTFAAGKDNTDMGAFTFETHRTYTGEMTLVGESVGITGVCKSKDVSLSGEEVETGYFNMIDATKERLEVEGENEPEPVASVNYNNNGYSNTNDSAMQQQQTWQQTENQNAYNAYSQPQQITQPQTNQNSYDAYYNNQGGQQQQPNPYDAYYNTDTRQPQQPQNPYDAYYNNQQSQQPSINQDPYDAYYNNENRQQHQQQQQQQPNQNPYDAYYNSREQQQQQQQQQPGTQNPYDAYYNTDQSPPPQAPPAWPPQPGSRSY